MICYGGCGKIMHIDDMVEVVSKGTLNKYYCQQCWEKVNERTGSNTASNSNNRRE